MRNIISLMLIGFISLSSLWAYEFVPSTIYPEIVYKDTAYQTTIRTVSLFRRGLKESYPVLYLNRDQNLVLTFDELVEESANPSDFFVDVISCNANWEPSGLLNVEFYDGFFNQRITEIQRSGLTRVPYFHYWYSFPNQGEKFKQSGNYLLKVYRDGNQDDIVLTRRFVVVEQSIGINLKYQLSAEPIRQQMENFSFEVNVGNLPVFDPLKDLHIKVLQNFRWDNSYENPQPRFQMGKKYEYFVNLMELFYGGNEFRRHECESYDLLGRNVQDIERRETMVDLFNYADEARQRNTYGDRRDRNGSYRISVMEYQGDSINADYFTNHFYVKSSERIRGDVYVFGEMTDWNLLPEFKMTYNKKLRRYEGEFLLKQGIYDYQYVVKYPDDWMVDESAFEGQHTPSENFYTIMVYFRGPTDRNDRLLGFLTVNYKE
ncbi:MAG: type IX secretion system plug protein domain-containing protein [Bacteroidota bacterium]